MSYIASKILMIPIVLIALTFHEFSHGFISTKLGDPTPRITGRLSLNPMAHLDPMGALLMVLTGFGWARPVQIDARYYKNPKVGMAITAAAGPLSNLLLAFLAMIIYTMIFILNIKVGLFSGSIDTISGFVLMFVQVNLCFMVFNLIPIPPLDGSRILGLFLSSRSYFKLQQLERYSFMIIVVLSLTGFFNRIIGTGVGVVLSALINLCNMIVQLVV
jgi:Zn-dependent protease